MEVFSQNFECRKDYLFSGQPIHGTGQTMSHLVSSQKIIFSHPRLNISPN